MPEQDEPLSPAAALALTTTFMNAPEADEQPPIPVPPVVVPTAEVGVSSEEIATVDGATTEAATVESTVTDDDALAGSSRGAEIANMAMLAAPDLLSFDTQLTGTPASLAPSDAETPEVNVPSPAPSTFADSMPVTAAIDFLLIEIDLQPIERSIRRHDPVRSIMPRGAERYVPFLVRALAIAGPKFPEMLTTHRQDRLDLLMRIVDDTSPATYPLVDVGNRRLSSIAEEVSIRSLETSDDDGANCPVSIAAVSRPGPSLGFVSDSGARRVALTLTGVDHRPVATTDRMGCSATALHTTAFLGATFSHEISLSRREPFIDELKSIMESRDWDTEIN